MLGEQFGGLRVRRVPLDPFGELDPLPVYDAQVNIKVVRVVREQLAICQIVPNGGEHFAAGDVPLDAIGINRVAFHVLQLSRR